MEDFQKSMHRYLEFDDPVWPLLRLGDNNTKKVLTGETGHEHDNFGTERWFEFRCLRSSSLAAVCTLHTVVTWLYSMPPRELAVLALNKRKHLRSSKFSVPS